MPGKHDEQHVRLARPVTAAQIRAFLGNVDSVIDFDKLQDTTPFTDAGADSLDFFNIISQLQEATGLDITDQDVEQVNTVAKLVVYLNAKMI